MLLYLYLPVLLVCCLCRNVALVSGQRNAEAEGMCQPFLTSNVSSPLIPDLRRNLKIDEDGEYFCELVLQDRELPGQVRVTIHEGLSFLAIRHVQMGLARHDDVLRHLKILAQLVPASFNFQFRAGVWSLDPMLAQPEQAVDFLRAALYGTASEDTTADEEIKMEARKHFAEALGYVAQFEEAQKELLIILKRFPLDFGVVFLMKETLHQLQVLRMKIPEALAEETRVALMPAEQLYASIAAQADVQYTGFKISQGWAPKEYSGEMPSAEALEEFVARREPFVVRSSGSGSELNSLLNWTVEHWSNIEYLRDAVGPEEDILVEKVTSRAKASSTFGFSGGVLKKKMSFTSFLDKNFGKNANSDTGSSECLNLPNGYFQEGIWSRPLNRLQADIPVPPCLSSRAENITSVNMWMSNAPEGTSLTSRLHMDPLDSLFVLVGGGARKIFRLHSPDQAPLVRTISPTYGVSPEGFSFQYDSPADLPSLESTVVANTGDGTVANPGESKSIPQPRMQGHEVGKGHYHFSSRLGEDEGVRSHGSEVELRPGDMLFVPAGWFHEVTTSSGPSVAVNYWWLPSQWRSTLAQERQMKAALVKKLQQFSVSGDKFEAPPTRGEL